MAENTKQFFQITEAARACGLSRSTLMRMEERGLLTPVFTAPDSGRRYYDNHNVARIMQIEKFKAMGLGSKEIADYFAQGGEAEVLLEALETRLRDLQRSVEEMRLRAAEGESLSVQMMELPAVTCRIRWCEGLTTAERYRDMYDFYGACVRKGACCRTSRCSPYRSARTIWRDTSGRSRSATGCACRCGRTGRRRTR